MSDFSGPEDKNDTSGKMIHMGTMDRAFIVLNKGYKFNYLYCRYPFNWPTATHEAAT
jgi:hypothetical protein